MARKEQRRQTHHKQAVIAKRRHSAIAPLDWRPTAKPASYRSPVYFLSIMTASVFTAETLVMLLFLILPKLPDLVEVFVDSTLLSLLISPCLYFCLFRPLVMQIAARKQTEETLRQYQEHLEELVTERTAALEALRQSEAKYRELLAREELFNQLANQIRNTLDLEMILETVVQEIYHLLQIERCQFAWYFPQADEPYWDVVKEARNPVLPNFVGRYLATDVGPLAQKLLKLEILRVDDVKLVEDSVWREFVVSLGMSSVLILPIQTRSGVIGVISCSHNTVRPWSDGEVELLHAVTDQLAIAINQAELYSQTRSAAVAAQAQTVQLQHTLQELQHTQTQLVQSEKMSSLGQLVAVAHEINNPVNFIYGNLVHAGGYTQDLLSLLQLYQQQYPQPTPAISGKIEAIDLDFLIADLPKLLSSMKVGAERIYGIVCSLRNFSRLDEADMKVVDIHEGIESTLLILQNRLKAKSEHPGIKVIKEYGNLPGVECYPGQLNQVFMNLLVNAIDALEESVVRSHISVVKNNEQRTVEDRTIRIRTQVTENNRVAIQITDNGSGMTEAVKNRLFDPFFTTKPTGVGTGLGLSISYQIIVEKHGGTLHCQSELGRGTEFIIQIPLQQSSVKTGAA